MILSVSATGAGRSMKAGLVLLPLVAVGIALTYAMTADRNQEVLSLQRGILCVASAVCCVIVGSFHWTHPPHPKFTLLPRRRLCIRLHVALGLCEFVAAVLAWLLDSPFYATATACLAFCHIVTAALQTPIVFGARAVMVPAYTLCLLLHGVCAVELLRNPTSTFWLSQTFLTYSIYAWVRIFYFLYRRWKLFDGWVYSSAVLSAGVTIVPAVLGPGAVLLVACFILLYVILRRALLSSVDFAEEMREHGRGLDSRRRLQRLWDTVVPEEHRHAEFDDLEQPRAAFAALDRDGNGKLTNNEIGVLLWQSKVDPGLAGALMQYLERMNPDGIDFDVFHQRIWLFGTAGRFSGRRFRRTRDPEEQARAVFDKLNLNPDETLDAFELRMLLLEWDLPEEDVQDALALYSDGGRISFKTFYERMKPLWKFAWYDVMDRSLHRSPWFMTG